MVLGRRLRIQTEHHDSNIYISTMHLFVQPPEVGICAQAPYYLLFFACRKYVEIRVFFVICLKFAIECHHLMLDGQN